MFPATSNIIIYNVEKTDKKQLEQRLLQAVIPIVSNDVFPV